MLDKEKAAAGCCGVRAALVVADEKWRQRCVGGAHEGMNERCKVKDLVGMASDHQALAARPIGLISTPAYKLALVKLGEGTQSEQISYDWQWWMCGIAERQSQRDHSCMSRRSDQIGGRRRAQ